MSSFQQLFDEVRREALAPKHGHRFKEARGRHPALTGYRCVTDLFAAMELDAREAYAEKEALTRALIAEQQVRPSSFWATVLLVAYYPMLSRLRHRIYGDALADEDLDQLVVTSFLSVVAEFSLQDKPDRTAMRLRQMTQRLVFRWVRQELREQRIVLLAESESIDELTAEVPSPGHGLWSVKRLAHMVDEDSLKALVVKRFGDVVDRRKLDLVFTTLLRGERLNRHVERLYPDTPPDERERIYQRLKRERERTIGRLREEFSTSPCPFFSREMLCPGRSGEPGYTSRSAP